MANNLTNFYERGLDVADVYIGKDEIETNLLNRSVDTCILSDIGLAETTQYTIWGWGDDASCNLGINTVPSCSPLISTRTNRTWRHISAAGTKNAAVKCDGTLWSWGLNSCGQLGDGTTVNKVYPSQEVSGSTDWCCVRDGDIFTVALKSDNTLWAWGSNYQGRIGNNASAFNNYCSPVQEVSASSWCEVSAKGAHVSAIKTDGSLWGWGSNTFGELGNDDTTSIGSGECSPVREVTNSTDWCAVGAGLNHTVAIKSGGTLWAWGVNFGGQLGDGGTTNRCSPVQEFTCSTNWCLASAGNFFSAAINTSCELWTWGDNTLGRLGTGDTVNKSIPTREATSGTDWCFANQGSCFMSAIKTNGTLWSWGRNVCGELGDGTTINRCSPVQENLRFNTWLCISSGYDHSFALKR